MEYRSMPRYANSDLSQFRDQLLGLPARKPSTAALVFGTLFHSLTLEQQPPTGINPKLDVQLIAMRDSVMQCDFARNAIQTGRVELVQTWEDELTGLPCKGKLDIWCDRDETIVDLKSTSARSYGEFLKCCEDYDYDRQAAFYLDGNPFAKRFVIIGVQKTAPFQVFYFEATAARGCIEMGRKKYGALLRDIERFGFTPTSWDKKAVYLQPLSQAA
ncbi:PD-(D/E)XK nuclease-like domain-containing protein [Spirosoma oryzae]|nr:PD-(D/E)XK nuclease-like domain-containing protein [Spirosoma oryzae]